MATFSFEKSFELDNSDAAFMAAFTRTVAARGADYRYLRPDNDEYGTSCVNVDTAQNCGSCLIGTVLVSMGVPVEWFVATEMIDAVATKVLDMFGFSTEIRAAARAAQEKQDSFEPWGKASDEFFSTYFDPARVAEIIRDYDF